MSTSKILIRSSGEPWRLPASIPFASEEALHTLLQQSPELLPWFDTSDVVVAREFEVPLTGPADLVFLSEAGEISVVECKLRANSEIRREVVGQIFAYTSGIARMTYEQFDTEFFARTQKRLGQAMAELAGESDPDWDEGVFRSNVAANLASGRMGLLIAVDEITEELKRTVEYINAHTTGDLRIMALEVDLVQDHGLEILLPTVYGEELIGKKTRAPVNATTNEDTLFAALNEWCTPEGVQAFRKLFEHARKEGLKFSWGAGVYPSAGARFVIDGETTTVWSCYSGPDHTSTLEINFNNLSWCGISSLKLQSLLHSLSSIPGVADRYSKVKDAEFKKRPPLFIDEYLTKPGAVDTIIKALDDLIAPAASSAKTVG